MLTGVGTVSAAVGSCANGVGPAKATMISGQVTLAQDAYITIDVSGSVCGVIGTGWFLDIACSEGTAHKAIDPVLIETIGLLESHVYESNKKESRLDDVKDNEGTKVDFNIYPNPASNTVSLHLLKDKLPYDLKVLDINGKVVFESKNIADTIFTFDVSELPKGMYFVDVVSDNIRHVKRLLVN